MPFTGAVYRGVIGMGKNYSFEPIRRQREEERAAAKIINDWVWEIEHTIMVDQYKIDTLKKRDARYENSQKRNKRVV